MTQRMGFLLLDDFALMSCAAAIEPLRAANLLAGQPLYDLTFLSVKGGPAAASVGAVFDTVSIDAETVPFDIVFVVAGGNPMASKYPEAARFLRQLDRRGVALGGISGGGVILAQSGLMLGRRFTVHWQHFDALREVSPGHLMERRLFVIDRDRFTCAGGSAPLDMMHALITAQHGIALAQKVADWFIHTRIREAGDPQKSGTAERYQLHHPVLVTTVDMMETHIADPLTVEQLATLADMSPRHLQRLFRDRMGLSLIRFYRDLRLDKARDLLSQTGLPILEVALATGFANGAHFARAFRDKFGTRPSTLRPTGIADQAGSTENSGLTST
ncbi:GlxA family transcriptional regulator (plasmid) [Rhodobacteraceae bacterium SC52]|nr:GlxA family transcriptional regulator [Rhodobacteraceae bacterium SC52]